ncbi:hypothetical protein AALC25_15155 [Lachnospiraceae bacterium 29-84]
MENEVWEKITQFLNQLRGEQLSRASSVRMPKLIEKQKQAEKLMEECRVVLRSIPEADRQLLIMLQEQVEKVSYLQEQKSYLQGYVDCIYCKVWDC